MESIDITFPWAKDVMLVLAPNLFMDATFHMTVYGYKVGVLSVRVRVKKRVGVLSFSGGYH